MFLAQALNNMISSGLWWYLEHFSPSAPQSILKSYTYVWNWPTVLIKDSSSNRQLPQCSSKLIYLLLRNTTRCLNDWAQVTIALVLTGGPMSGDWGHGRRNVRNIVGARCRVQDPTLLMTLWWRDSKMLQTTWSCDKTSRYLRLFASLSLL